jgi:drug/metabolite transporter (DMT)-like permease
MNLGYRKIKFGVDITGLAGIIYLIAFIYNELFLPLKFTLHVVILMSIAGFFCFAAFVFGNYALQSGPGAIVNAVIQSQSVL